MKRPGTPHRFNIRNRLAVCLVVTAMLSATGRAGNVEEIRQELLDGKPVIERPRPDPKGGQAYRLSYIVDVPVEIYWRFKTDFENNFVTTHRFITAHRVIHRSGNRVVTENTYRSHGDMVFRWQTTVHSNTRRLEYILLNPRSVEHRFHYGTIDVLPLNGRTLVTQTAYFSFFGASLWANLPVLGGMRSSLKYTVRWEQETVRRLKGRYGEEYQNPSEPAQANPSGE